MCGVWMDESQKTQITQILGELSGGERSAAERLVPFVYNELRALAGSYLRNYTLFPTRRSSDQIGRASCRERVYTLFPYTTLFRLRSEERRVGKECNQKYKSAYM